MVGKPKWTKEDKAALQRVVDRYGVADVRARVDKAKVRTEPRLVANLGLKAALKLIAKPKPEKVENKTEKPTEAITTSSASTAQEVVVEPVVSTTVTTVVTDEQQGEPVQQHAGQLVDSNVTAAMADDKSVPTGSNEQPVELV